MDVYETALQGRRNREVAGTDGVSYVVPLAGYNWFRWKGIRQYGQWERGSTVWSHLKDALQVYDHDAWHPVVSFSGDYIGPAADYTVAGVKMFKDA